MSNLPTAWQQFINSNFRYRPARGYRNGSVQFRTNKAAWAKQ